MTTDFDPDTSLDSGIVDQSVSNISDITNFTINATAIPANHVPYDQRPETYIVPVLFAIIFFIGVLGNGTLIIIFLRHRTMRNVPNTYIFSLALGDMMVILFCVPFTSTIYTLDSWPYGEFICKLSEFVKDISIGVSVFTLTALSADRYFAIVDPMKRHVGRRATRLTLFTATGIWVLSIIIALPSVLFSYDKVFRLDDASEIHVCYPFPEDFGDNYPKLIITEKFLVYYAIPLLIITSFYVIMAYHLLLSTRSMPTSQQQGKQIIARKKVAKMVLSFVVIFALCFFPYHVFFLWFYYYPNAQEHYNHFWHAFRIIGFCLSFINSCINPIALYCVSGTFRKYFNKHLFCCLCPKAQMIVRQKSTWEGNTCRSVYKSCNGTVRSHEEITLTSTMLSKT